MTPSAYPDGLPKPGYYKTRLVRGGPWVPVRIWIQDGMRDRATGELLSDQRLHWIVDGREINPFEDGPYPTRHFFFHPIDRDEFDLMVARSDHAWRWRRDDPEANPRKRVDLNRAKPIF